MYIVFNILVQLIIVLMSVGRYFDVFDIRLLLAFILTYLIFIPSIIEFFFNVKLKKSIHYLVTITCLIIFLILIAI